ncbi:hypothetical protein MesoLj131b_70560 (plasmid) [Mesorhizobium sp. 131-2-5]|uniref:DUF6946 family protein n=1 Tax=Mesorhizobium sp. 131-2-5 TaxID=2744519 RepID=UPI0019295D7A|nr:hypothetical protein [Mesorhizobium sp. 131-2-5]BCH05057.1 hypothetical protein MesoLj131b_70560 [Mesorhizobium sp. 131-2-5]
MPDEIAQMFDVPAELLLALPEHKVPFDGGNRDSQNDVFALIRFGDHPPPPASDGSPSVWYIDVGPTTDPHELALTERGTAAPGGRLGLQDHLGQEQSWLDGLGSV